MRLRLALGLLTAALLVPAAPAQEAPRTITFDEALRIALDQNPAVRQAENAQAAREQDVRLQRAQFYPDLVGSVQPTHRFGLTFDQTSFRQVSETSQSVDFGVSSSVNLFNGFRDQRGLQEARYQAEASRASLARTQQEVLFDVASAYLQHVLDGELVGIQEEAVRAQALQLERTEELIGAGLRPRTDVFQQQALLAERELALLEARNDRTLSATRLLQVLALDPTEAYAFTAPALDADGLARPTYDLDALLQTALERRDDLEAQEAAIRAAAVAVSGARGGYLPSVSLFANYGTGYSSLAQLPVAVGDPVTIPVTTGAGEPILVGGEPFVLEDQEIVRRDVAFFDQFRDNRSGAVGLSVRIPILDRGTTRAQVATAELQLANERIRLEALRQAVALDVQQALLEYRNAGARLDVTARQVEAAQAALEAAESRYELGAATALELSDAQEQLVRAQSARAQAVYQFVFRQKLLDYATGTLDPSEPIFE